MAKTNKEIRGDLATKYHDELRKVDDTLEFLEKSGYSKEEIQSTRERLISNLQSKLSEEDGYEEARTAHRKELKAKGSVSSAKQEKEKLQKEYEEEKEKLQKEYEEEKEKLQRRYEEKMAEADRDMSEKSKAYEDAQVAYRGKVEDKVEVEEGVKEGKGLESLRGNKDAILDALKESHVKIEENAEVMGYKGKKVHINLPKVGNFEGFKFDYFVSEDYVTKKDFEKKPELEKKSYSMNDVGNLLKAMNRFMAALGCEIDGNMKYENELKNWETNTYRCDAGDYLKAITGLNDWYWLSDKNVAGRKDSRANWYCNVDFCYFYRYVNDDNYANLFLRLSD